MSDFHVEFDGERMNLPLPTRGNGENQMAAYDAAEREAIGAVGEALRAVRWIKEFCEAHHAGEPSGVHLHRLLVDVPHYLDYVIATLEDEQ